LGRVRLFICTKTLHHWRSQLSDKPKSIQSSDEKLNITKLETELKRVTKERDLLKKPLSDRALEDKRSDTIKY